MDLLVKKTLEQHLDVAEALMTVAPEIVVAGQRCADALARGDRIYLCGNGGSAGDAQHIAAELVGRFVSDRRSLPAIALTTDTSALTAIANDYGYQNVFSRQVSGLVNRGDVLIAISTSGNSENILLAVAAAQKLGGEVLGLTGADGGALAATADFVIQVPSEVTARIQEMHILIGHCLCECIESVLFLER